MCGSVSHSLFRGRSWIQVTPISVNTGTKFSTPSTLGSEGERVITKLHVTDSWSLMLNPFILIWSHFICGFAMFQRVQNQHGNKLTMQVQSTYLSRKCSIVHVFLHKVWSIALVVSTNEIIGIVHASAVHCKPTVLQQWNTSKMGEYGYIKGRKSWLHLHIPIYSLITYSISPRSLPVTSTIFRISIPLSVSWSYLKSFICKLNIPYYIINKYMKWKPAIKHA